MIELIVGGILLIILSAAIIAISAPEKVNVDIVEIQCPYNDAIPLMIYPIEANPSGYHCICSTTFSYGFTRYIFMGTAEGEPTVVLKQRENAVENVFQSDLPNPCAAISAVVNVANNYLIIARNDGLWKLTWTGMAFQAVRIRAKSSFDFGRKTTMGLIAIANKTFSDRTGKVYSSFIPNPEGITIAKNGRIQISRRVVEPIPIVENQIKSIHKNEFPNAEIYITNDSSSNDDSSSDDDDSSSDEDDSSSKISKNAYPQLATKSQEKSRAVDSLFDRKIPADESPNRVMARIETVNLLRRKVAIAQTYRPPKSHYYEIYVTAVASQNPRYLPFDKISEFLVSKVSLDTKGTLESYCALNLRDGAPLELTNYRPTESAWVIFALTKPVVIGRMAKPVIEPKHVSFACIIQTVI